MTFKTISDVQKGLRRGLLQRAGSLATSVIAVIEIIAVMVPLLLVSTAHGASICRWVNEDGHAEFSDVVPDRYKGAVTCTHQAPPDALAAQRAAAERLKNKKAGSDRPRDAASSPEFHQQNPVRQGNAKRPAEIVTDKTDCANWRRLFEESGACFAPFRTVGGGIKAQAFEQCNEIPNPELKCGPQFR